jgi:rhodanese-related sulfurtransferase
MDAYLLHKHQTSIAPTPSGISAAAMSRLSRDQLATFLLNPTALNEPSQNSPLAGLKASDLAVIDVRDDDYIGGHILGGTNVPSSNLEWKLPELVRTHWEKKAVVFHCALSQVRGPSAAAKYARERERQEKQRWAMEDGPAKSEPSATNVPEEKKEAQQVFVLEGGFVKWQEKYGVDKRLTEAYAKDIWEETFY